MIDAPVTQHGAPAMALRTNNFDLIRLLAALQVAVGHSCAWLGLPIPGLVLFSIHCFPGVAVFFVISGFLVTRSYVEGNRGLLSYFTRRALRVYPALWLQYLFVIILLWVTGGFALGTLGDSRFWSWMVRAAFIGSNFWAGALTNYSPFVWTGLYQWYPADVLWTIPVELGFYLLVPLVFAKWIVRRKLVIPVVAAAFAASVVAAFIAGPLLRDHGNLNSTGMIHSSPLPYFWLFLSGAVATFYWDKAKWLFDGTVLWWLAGWLRHHHCGQMAGGRQCRSDLPDARRVHRAAWARHGRLCDCVRALVGMDLQVDARRGSVVRSLPVPPTVALRASLRWDWRELLVRRLVNSRRVCARRVLVVRRREARPWAQARQPALAGA